ncbi:MULTISPECIES: hypothetical protein [Trichocoleus]|uniref:Uncharacterized protein n=1 Tax=Trichocoleus desertorum GB2-A4 TaxID=2933944 RepID=A0ABV0J3B3_9CYAN|nr:MULTISPECIES: hypothetical protein [unclassified Trichocoleus]MBD1861597.1 hypothetical protein [Trichocoleus sp. FACHB-46]MBD2098503.1 hypothetical protein [Trichocoleus sp. FACHB-591]
MAKSSRFSGGFAVGLKWSLFFLLCFFILGYSAVFSVLLASMGGFATSLITDWWNAKADPQPATTSDAAGNQANQPKAERVLTRAEKWQRATGTHRRRLPRLKWPFGKR